MPDFPLNYSDPWIDPLTAPEPPRSEKEEDRSPEWLAWRQRTHFEDHGFSASEIELDDLLTVEEMTARGLMPWTEFHYPGLDEESKA